MAYRNTLAADNINPFQLHEPREVFAIFMDLPKSCGRFYGLKKGFGHCFMLLHFADNQWWVIDPLFNSIMYARLRFANDDVLDRTSLLQFLQNKGCQIVSVSDADSDRIAAKKGRWQKLQLQGAMVSFGVFSCVTLIKRSLGIRRPWIITPYQLFKFLIEQKWKKCLI